MLKKLKAQQADTTRSLRIDGLPYLFSFKTTTNSHYAAAFSHEIVLSEDSALTKVSKSGGGGKSGTVVDLLRQALPHLDTATYQAHMELAVNVPYKQPYAK